MKHLKKAATAALTLMLCSAAFTGVQAQITNASNTDIPLTITVGGTPVNVNSINTMNSDMVTTLNGTKAWAVVLDGNVTGVPNYFGFRIEAGWFNQCVQLTEAFNPDIVIADNTAGTLGQDYLVTVVYEKRNTLSSYTEIYMDIYPYSGLGTATVAIGVPVLNIPVMTTNLHHGNYPHIDLFGDRSATYPSSTIHQLHDCIVTWDEATPATSTF